MTSPSSKLCAGSVPSAFITGATGQDGSYLAEKLSAAGWDVHGLVREGIKGEHPLPDAVFAHVGDLGVTGSVAEIIERVRPDVVFNFAGVSSVAQSWSDPMTTAKLSGLSVAEMLEACWGLTRHGHAVRFLQASSAEIFADSPGDLLDETTPIRPASPYGAAKAFAHHLVDVYRGRGLWACSAILFNHESPRRPPTFVTRKITMAVAAIAMGRAETLELGNLDAQRDWGWAPEYVDAMIAMTGASEPHNYVIATGVTHSVREFVDAAFLAAGVGSGGHVTINEAWNRPTDAPALRGDSSAIRRELGWTPTLSFAEIVAAMVHHDLEMLR